MKKLPSLLLSTLVTALAFMPLTGFGQSSAGDDLFEGMRSIYKLNPVGLFKRFDFNFPAQKNLGLLVLPYLDVNAASGATAILAEGDRVKNEFDSKYGHVWERVQNRAIAEFSPLLMNGWNQTSYQLGETGRLHLSLTANVYPNDGKFVTIYNVSIGCSAYLRIAGKDGNLSVYLASIFHESQTCTSPAEIEQTCMILIAKFVKENARARSSHE